MLRPRNVHMHGRTLHSRQQGVHNDASISNGNHCSEHKLCLAKQATLACNQLKTNGYGIEFELTIPIRATGDRISPRLRRLYIARSALVYRHIGDRTSRHKTNLSHERMVYRQIFSNISTCLVLCLFVICAQNGSAIETPVSDQIKQTRPI